TSSGKSWCELAMPNGMASGDIPETLAHPTTLSRVRFADPRAMTDQERSLLDFLLSAEFPGVEALREQARHAQVDGLTSGSPGFWLSVDRSKAAPAELALNHRNHPI